MGFISGKVRFHGEILSGVEVQVLRVSDWAHIDAIHSDSQGDFLIEGLSPDTYEVRFFGRGVDSSIWYQTVVPPDSISAIDTDARDAIMQLLDGGGTFPPSSIPDGRQLLDITDGTGQFEIARYSFPLLGVNLVPRKYSDMEAGLSGNFLTTHVQQAGCTATVATSEVISGSRKLTITPSGLSWYVELKKTGTDNNIPLPKTSSSTRRFIVSFYARTDNIAGTTVVAEIAPNSSSPVTSSVNLGYYWDRYYFVADLSLANSAAYLKFSGSLLDVVDIDCVMVEPAENTGKQHPSAFKPGGDYSDLEVTRALRLSDDGSQILEWDGTVVAVSGASIPNDIIHHTGSGTLKTYDDVTTVIDGSYFNTGRPIKLRDTVNSIDLTAQNLFYADGTHNSLSYNGAAQDLYIGAGKRLMHNIDTNPINAVEIVTSSRLIADDRVVTDSIKDLNVTKNKTLLNRITGNLVPLLYSDFAATQSVYTVAGSTSFGTSNDRVSQRFLRCIGTGSGWEVHLCSGSSDYPMKDPVGNAGISRGFMVSCFVRSEVATNMNIGLKYTGLFGDGNVSYPFPTTHGGDTWQRFDVYLPLSGATYVTGMRVYLYSSDNSIKTDISLVMVELCTDPAPSSPGAMKEASAWVPGPDWSRRVLNTDFADTTNVHNSGGVLYGADDSYAGLANGAILDWQISESKTAIGIDGPNLLPKKYSDFEGTDSSSNPVIYAESGSVTYLGPADDPLQGKVAVRLSPSGASGIFRLASGLADYPLRLSLTGSGYYMLSLFARTDSVSTLYLTIKLKDSDGHTLSLSPISIAPGVRWTRYRSAAFGLGTITAACYIELSWSAYAYLDIDGIQVEPLSSNLKTDPGTWVPGSDCTGAIVDSDLFNQNLVYYDGTDFRRIGDDVIISVGMPSTAVVLDPVNGLQTQSGTQVTLSHIDDSTSGTLFRRVKDPYVNSSNQIAAVRVTGSGGVDVLATDLLYISTTLKKNNADASLPLGSGQALTHNGTTVITTGGYIGAGRINSSGAFAAGVVDANALAADANSLAKVSNSLLSVNGSNIKLGTGVGLEMDAVVVLDSSRNFYGNIASSATYNTFAATAVIIHAGSGTLTTAQTSGATTVIDGTFFSTGRPIQVRVSGGGGAAVSADNLLYLSTTVKRNNADTSLNLGSGQALTHNGSTFITTSGYVGPGRINSSGAFAAGVVDNAALATDSASLAKVSGGTLTVSGTNVKLGVSTGFQTSASVSIIDSAGAFHTNVADDATINAFAVTQFIRHSGSGTLVTAVPLGATTVINGTYFDSGRPIKVRVSVGTDVSTDDLLYMSTTLKKNNADTYINLGTGQYLAHNSTAFITTSGYLGAGRINSSGAFAAGVVDAAAIGADAVGNSELATDGASLAKVSNNTLTVSGVDVKLGASSSIITGGGSATIIDSAGAFHRDIASDATLNTIAVTLVARHAGSGTVMTANPIGATTLIDGTYFNLGRPTRLYVSPSLDLGTTNILYADTSSSNRVSLNGAATNVVLGTGTYLSHVAGGAASAIIDTNGHVVSSKLTSSTQAVNLLPKAYSDFESSPLLHYSGGYSYETALPLGSPRYLRCGNGLATYVVYLCTGIFDLNVALPASTNIDRTFIMSFWARRVSGTPTVKAVYYDGASVNTIFTASVTNSEWQRYSSAVSIPNGVSDIFVGFENSSNVYQVDIANVMFEYAGPSSGGYTAPAQFVPGSAMAGTVYTDALKDLAVTTPKLAYQAVTADKIDAHVVGHTHTTFNVFGGNLMQKKFSDFEAGIKPPFFGADSPGVDAAAAYTGKYGLRVIHGSTTMVYLAESASAYSAYFRMTSSGDNVKFLLSFWAKSNTAGVTSTCLVQVIGGDGGTESSLYNSSVLIPKEWERVVIPFSTIHIPVDRVRVQLMGDHTGYDVLIDDVQLELVDPSAAPTTAGPFIASTNLARTLVTGDFYDQSLLHVAGGIVKYVDNSVAIRADHLSQGTSGGGFRLPIDPYVNSSGHIVSLQNNAETVLATKLLYVDGSNVVTVDGSSAAPVFKTITMRTADSGDVITLPMGTFISGVDKFLTAVSGSGVTVLRIGGKHAGVSDDRPYIECNNGLGNQVFLMTTDSGGRPSLYLKEVSTGSGNKIFEVTETAVGTALYVRRLVNGRELFRIDDSASGASSEMISLRDVANNRYALRVSATGRVKINPTSQGDTGFAIPAGSSSPVGYTNLEAGLMYLHTTAGSGTLCVYTGSAWRYIPTQASLPV